MASFWSQPAWLTLHLFSLTETVPQEDMYSLFQSYSRSMPCPQCRQHMQQYLSKHPITSGTNMFAYSVALHNDVNKRQGKPQVSVQDAKTLLQQYIRNFVEYKQKYKSIVEHVAHVGGSTSFGVPQPFDNVAGRSCIGLALLCAVLICALVVVCIRHIRQKGRSGMSGGIRDSMALRRFAF